MPVVRGVELVASDSGTGTGLPLLWGHGFTSCMQADGAAPLLDWDRLAARHRVVRWDARGHGRSGGTPDPTDYRWDHLAGDMIGLADAYGLDRFVAAGVSMGAAAALHAAAQAPGRVLGLVLVLPPTAYETRPAQAEEYEREAVLVEDQGVGAYARLVDAQPKPAILSGLASAYRYEPAVPEHLLPAVLRGAAASDLPPPELVRSMTAPTLLLAWDTDPGHPLSTVERLAQLLPHPEVHIARRLREVAAWTDHVEAYLGGLA